MPILEESINQIGELESEALAKPAGGKRQDFLQIGRDGDHPPPKGKIKVGRGSNATQGREGEICAEEFLGNEIAGYAKVQGLQSGEVPGKPKVVARRWAPDGENSRAWRWSWGSGEHGKGNG